MVVALVLVGGDVQKYYGQSVRPQSQSFSYFNNQAQVEQLVTHNKRPQQHKKIDMAFLQL